ncbi:MAG: hypothetical protein SWH61_13175 [Thermodesulfobacteriota bacterium]|nr:hypothetical protein [Thermodesulfobacteriota bacterium]
MMKIQRKRLGRGVLGMLGVLAAVLSLGMGNVDGDGVVEIPQAVRNFTVTLTDASGLTLRLTNFTCEGKTFFSGKLGRADASVDFADIQTVTIGNHKDGQVLAVIALKNGDSVTLVMDTKLACYGSSAIADIRISIADIRRIENHGQAESGA